MVMVDGLTVVYMIDALVGNKLTGTRQQILRLQVSKTSVNSF